MRDPGRPLWPADQRTVIFVLVGRFMPLVGVISGLMEPALHLLNNLCTSVVDLIYFRRLMEEAHMPGFVCLNISL